MNHQLQLLLHDICRLLDVSVSDVQSPRVQRQLNFARYLFAHFAKEVIDSPVLTFSDEIAAMINRSPANFHHFLKAHTYWLHRVEYRDLYVQMTKRVENLKPKKQAA